MLRKYLASLWADWVARMSGVASVILAFLAAYLEFIVKHGKAALWVTAAICFVIASYRIWAKEHQALEAKQAELDAVLANNDAALHGQTKRDYIIQRLQELIRQHGQLPTGWIDSDDPRFGMWGAFSRDAERFLAQYFDEAHVKRFKERGKGVVVLEEVLLEYLK